MKILTRKYQRIHLPALFICIPFFINAQQLRSRLNDSLPQLRSYIKEKMTASSAPGFSVAVSQDGKIIWEEGFGFADKEANVAATPHTRYPVGSVTKTMTMTAIMQLVKQGRIKLDDPVSKYLKTVKLISGAYNTDSITLRKIASHTAGIARYTTIYYKDENVICKPLAEILNSYAWIMRPPSETYEYSDLDYGILAQLITDVSGEDYYSFMKKNIFLPLHMDDSFIDTGFVKQEAVAASYTEGKKMPLYYSPVSGAAAAYSSVHDMVQFGMYHLNKKNSASLSEMQKPLAARAPGYSYGMAWHIYENYGGYKVITHHGHNGYATATFFVLPEENICIAAAVNTSSAMVEEVGDKILSILLPAFDNKSLADQRRIWNPPAASFKTSEPWLGHWKGEIKFDTLKIPLQLWFQPDGDIHVQLKNQYRTLLNGVRTQDGYVRGSFYSDLSIPGAKEYPANLHLKIKLRGDTVINGSITQSSHSTDRVSVLSYYVEFMKEKE